MEWAHDQWPGHVVITKQSLNANVPLASAVLSNNQWYDYKTLQAYGLPGGMQAVWKSVQDCADGGNGFPPGDDWAGSRMHGAQICGDSVQNFVDTTNAAASYTPSWVEFYEADLGSLTASGNATFSPQQTRTFPSVIQMTPWHTPLASSTTRKTYEHILQ